MPRRSQGKRTSRHDQQRGGGLAYTLRVVLRDAPYPVWRGVIVPSDITLARLHDILQAAMGWTDSHLHAFVIDGEKYGPKDPDGDLDSELALLDERRARLGRLVARVGQVFEYQYDFGDNWEHDVTLMAIVDRFPADDLPCVVAGEGACPPEDVGGTPGFEDFLEAMSSPAHEQHDDYVRWHGGVFDANAFSVDRVNARFHRRRARGA